MFVNILVEQKYNGPYWSNYALSRLNRRAFLERAAAAAAWASARPAHAADVSELKPIQAEIEKRHDEAVHRLQDWIHQPSIAAENRGHDGRLRSADAAAARRRDSIR